MLVTVPSRGFASAPQPPFPPLDRRVVHPSSFVPRETSRLFSLRRIALDFDAHPLTAIQFCTRPAAPWVRDDCPAVREAIPHCEDGVVIRCSIPACLVLHCLIICYLNDASSLRVRMLRLRAHAQARSVPRETLRQRTRRFMTKERLSPLALIHTSTSLVNPTRFRRAELAGHQWAPAIKTSPGASYESCTRAGAVHTASLQARSKTKSR